MLSSVALAGRLVVGVIALNISIGSTALAQVQGMTAFDNRIEGTNIHTNALEDFTLVAVHKHFHPFSPNATLHVRFFLPKAALNPEARVFLEASELQDSFHYFMQANSGTWRKGDWNVFEPWPTKDVIDPLGLSSSNVGVRAGYRIGNGPQVFLPVDVYQNDGQSIAGAYTFYFITGADLQSLEVSVTNAAGLTMNALKLQLKCNKIFNPACKLYAAGSAHAFPLDMSKLPQGEYHIRLLGHVPGNLTPTSLDIVIYHAP